MYTVETLFSNLNTYQDMTNISSSNYVNLTVSPTNIQTWINVLGNYRDGIYIDSDPSQTIDRNPNYAI